MSYIVGDKRKLVVRIRRIQGQLAAAEKAITEEQDSTPILHLVAACRGAIDSLMAEIIEHHVREHILDPSQDVDSEQAMATEELIDVIKTYLR